MDLYSSSFLNAPQLGVGASVFTQILDTVLVDGFASVSAESVYVRSNQVWVNKANHGLLPGARIQMQGTTLPAANGVFKVVRVDKSTFTYACPGQTDSIITGSANYQVKPLGWSKHVDQGVHAYYHPNSSFPFTLCYKEQDNNYGRIWLTRSHLTTLNITQNDKRLPKVQSHPNGLYYTKRWAYDYANVSWPWYIWGDKDSLYIINRMNAARAGRIFGAGVYDKDSEFNTDPYFISVSEQDYNTDSVANGIGRFYLSNNSEVTDIWTSVLNGRSTSRATIVCDGSFGVNLGLSYSGLSSNRFAALEQANRVELNAANAYLVCNDKLLGKLPGIAYFTTKHAEYTLTDHRVFTTHQDGVDKNFMLLRLPNSGYILADIS